jgi:hypothetical protein
MILHGLLQGLLFALTFFEDLFQQVCLSLHETFTYSFSLYKQEGGRALSHPSLVIQIYAVLINGCYCQYSLMEDTLVSSGELI